MGQSQNESGTWPGWDRAGFAGLVREHGPVVHAYLARRAGRQVAGDLFSEVWLRAWRSKESYNPCAGPVLPWLLGIARNSLRAYFRLRARSLGPTFELHCDPWIDADERLDAARVARTLERALGSLTEEYREILLLVAWEQLSPAEIAQLLHMPPGTVRSRLHRARGALRDYLHAELISGSSSAGPTAQGAPFRSNVLTSYVVEHSLVALASTSEYVEQVVQHDPSGIYMSWRGPTQLLDEFPGQSATLWTWAAPGVDTVLSIDYLHHTWSRSVLRAPQPPGGPIGGPPPPGAYVFSQKAVAGPEPEASSISSLFRQPELEVIGTSMLDGAATYELRIPALGPNGKPVVGKGLTAWVNAHTYLPVRIASDAPAGVPAWTQDFTWQPATPQALAIFGLEAPAHFHQVSDPNLQPVPPGR